MIEILTNWGEDALLNTINLLNGRLFEQEKDGFRPFPPGIYFSDDKAFMRSMINHYSAIRYQLSLFLKNITIGDFGEYLKSKKTDEEGLKKIFQIEYLVEYRKKYKDCENNKLITLVSDMNIKRVHFIYKGMYLFGIMPEYFVRFKNED